jgi:hypothetical protein
MFLGFFVDYVDMNYNTTKTNTYVFFGPVRFRFFKTNTYDCLSEFTTVPDIKILLSEFNIKCYYRYYTSNTENKTGLFNNKYTWTNNTNTTHVLQLPFGEIDEDGIVIDIFTNK